MKRCKVLLAGAVLAAMSFSVGGCATAKQKEDAAARESEQRYKLLNGSTADSSNKPAAEPALKAETRFAAGQLAESTGKLDCAVVQYEQAVRLDKTHVPSLYRLGVVLTRMQQYDKAATAWKQYIKATGEVASGYSNLGFCYEMAGDAANAEQAYKDGIARDGESNPCRVNYGLMLARQNRQTEAEVQLSAVLKPDDVAYNLAAVYEQQGKIDLAKAELKRALEVNPKNTAAQQRLATLPQD
ncbi:MAG: tetratricopeptide repeat protein [Tepidisphaeraceae bacterium]